MNRVIIFFLFFFFSNPGYSQPVPEINEVPNTLPAAQKILLNNWKVKLIHQKDSINDEIEKFNIKCDNTPLIDECKKEEGQLIKGINQLTYSINEYEGTRIIYAMIALSKNELRWEKDEQIRLDSALNRLKEKVYPAATESQIIDTWRQMQTRGDDNELMNEASQGNGPGLPGAGKQSFEDCTIFALANATGQPYGAVAARATKLISEGEWRNATDRSKPQDAIEKKGLMGYEVAMLTEAFGQVDVIPSSDFARTLKDGHRVMISVVPDNGDINAGHRVVLTKTFQHDGETWYEMIDSNQEGSQQRLYLSNKELATILKQKGIVYRPDPGTTPKLLR